MVATMAFVMTPPNAPTPPKTSNATLTILIGIGIVFGLCKNFVFGCELNEINNEFGNGFDENYFCNGDYNAFFNASPGMFNFDFFEIFFFAGYATTLAAFPRRVDF